LVAGFFAGFFALGLAAFLVGGDFVSFLAGVLAFGFAFTLAFFLFRAA
jgi:hypothetical protein